MQRAALDAPPVSLLLEVCYLGLDWSAAFSTAAPVAFTSLPAPSTVLQPATAASNATAINVVSVFISLSFDGCGKRCCVVDDALRVPAAQDSKVTKNQVVTQSTARRWLCIVYIPV
jgi:hypothetical protein